MAAGKQASVLWVNFNSLHNPFLTARQWECLDTLAQVELFLSCFILLIVSINRVDFDDAVFIASDQSVVPVVKAYGRYFFAL